MATLIKPSFAGGEISPALHARVDLAKYQTGLALCRNFFIQAHGGASNRAGLRFCGEVKASGVAGRLVPFQFNTTDAYALEFGEGVMRVVKNGAYVLESAKTITAITQANPGVVTSNAHGYANGEEIYVAGVGGMTALNGRNFIVRNATTNTFTLETRAGAAVNTTALAAFTSGGTAARIYQLTVPYTAADLALLKWEQSADTMTLVHPSYAPRDLTRTSDASWTLTSVVFAPSISAPAAPAVTPNTTGSTTYSYVVTAIAASGEESVASPTTTITNGNAAANNTITWGAVSGAVSYVIYKQGSGLLGFIGRSTALTFTDSNIKPDETDSPQTANNPFPSAGNYPGCVTFHEERKWFGRTNTKRQTLFASQPGAYNNFGVSTPTKDDDGIEVALVSRQVHEIRHLISLGGLLVMTSGGEWIAKPGGQSDAITPLSLTVKPQSYRGSSDVRPIVVGNMALYVQDRGQIVRDLGYKFDVDSYTGDDLTLLARHLFEGRTIKEWAYAQAPHSIIWCVMSDGGLMSLTYLREHEVWAWARHDTDGDFESVAVISDGTEDVPYFIVRRTIGGQTRRYVERMASRLVLDVEDAFFVDCGLTLNAPVAISGITSANPPVITTATAHGLTTGDLVDVEGTQVFNPDYPATSDDRFLAHATARQRYQVTVLSGTTFQLRDYLTGVNVDGSAWAAWGRGGNVRRAVTTLSGLEHLNGKSVAILANGDVLPNQVVANGTITLERAASRIHVGLSYYSDLQTLRLDTGGSPDGTMQGRKKAIPYVTLRLERTRGLKAGPRETHLREMKSLLTGYNEAAGLVTGDYRLSVPSDQSTGGQLFFRQEYPLPCTLLGIIPEVQFGSH
ncbi:MAG: hypothetical protein ING29_13080 [Azospirillum sp.]|nr:hypothetical protein [Azospirillum sp.]